MSAAQVALEPTWRGHVNTTMDALVLFEACLMGRMNHVPRRPHDRERDDLIRSGNVFIYEEHSSGIKRWTDGYNWSPSRILNNFLIYRELEKAFAPGEKKKALKKKNSNNNPSSKNGIVKSESSSRTSSTSSANIGAAVAAVTLSGCDENGQNNADRALIGSLVDSYPFKEDGLVKKTISITHKGVPHHLVSYYNVEDVKNNTLMTPLQDPQFFGLYPRPDLIQNQNFRVAVDHEEHTLHVGEGWMQQVQNDFFRMKSAGQAGMMPAEWTGQRSMSVPQIHPQFYQQPTNHYPPFQHHGGLPPYEPPAESGNGYYHLPAPQGEQEYTLSAAPPSFPPRQSVPQIQNGLPDLLHHHQRRNTVHAANSGLHGTDFSGLQSGALSLMAPEPRVFSGPNSGFLPTSINMISGALTAAVPAEADIMQGPGGLHSNMINSGATTGTVTPNESSEALHSDWPGLNGQDFSNEPYFTTPSWNTNSCAEASPR